MLAHLCILPWCLSRLTLRSFGCQVSQADSKLPEGQAALPSLHPPPSASRCPSEWRRQFSCVWVRFLLTSPSAFYPRLPAAGSRGHFHSAPSVGLPVPVPAGQDLGVEERQANGREDMAGVLALGTWLGPVSCRIYAYGYMSTRVCGHIVCVCVCVWHRMLPNSLKYTFCI